MHLFTHEQSEACEGDLSNTGSETLMLDGWNVNSSGVEDMCIIGFLSSSSTLRNSLMSTQDNA